MANRFSITRQADASAATGTAKTMARIAPGANNPVTIIAVSVWFDSVAASDKPIKVALRSETTLSAGTSTAFTPLPLQPIGASNATCGVNFSAEGAPTYAASDFEDWMIPATSGIYVQYPLGREIIIATNAAFRLAVTAITNTVNVSYLIEFEE